METEHKKIIIKGSGIPEKYYNKKLNQVFINNSENVDKDKHLQLIDKYMKNYDWIKEGKNILLWGSNCGSGKTLWASKIAYNYIIKDLEHFDNEPDGNVLRLDNAYYYYCPVKFVLFTEFIAKIKDNLNFPSRTFKYEIDALKRADLVIWDDLLNECVELPKSVWETLFNIMEYRAGIKSNIYTSNRDPNTFQTYLGAEIVSRMLTKCDIYKFENADLRKVTL